MLGEHIPRVTRRGTYTAQVTYIPNLGPDGQHGGLQFGFARPGSGVFLVGRSEFTVP
jgi:hypothetical protein